MKKVLHYVTLMNRAGEETFIMNVFRNINRKNVMFDFLVTEDKQGDYDKEILQLGGQIHHIQLNRMKGKLKQIDNVNILRKKLVSFNHEYDYFHIHTQHAMDAYLSVIAAKLAGIKNIIVHSHNSSTTYSIRNHRIFKIALDHLDITRFACGIDAGNWMFKSKKFTVIENGIDLNDFKFNVETRKKVRKKLGWENKYIIGHVGRFNVQKNQKFLIDIFKKLHTDNSNFKLVLVGDGELRSQLTEKVDKLGLNKSVQFLGIRNDMNEIYQAFDVLVFPSLFEGLPVSLIEAQAADLPIIMSDSITSEVVINDNVVRIDVNNNVNKWCSEILKVYSTNNRRFDTSGKLTRSGYNIKNVTKKLELFYLKGKI